MLTLNGCLITLNYKTRIWLQGFNLAPIPLINILMESSAVCKDLWAIWAAIPAMTGVMWCFRSSMLHFFFQIFSKFQKKVEKKNGKNIYLMLTSFCLNMYK